MRGTWPGLALCVALLAIALALPSAASAAEAYFPSATPPATQITREFNLKDAARRGLVKLTPKGGIEGDQVQMEVVNKKVRGPITITLHIEFTVKKRVDAVGRLELRENLPEYERDTAAELNRGKYKTAQGDPINFKVDYKFRNPEDTPRYNHHQILVLDPLLDLDQPDPEYRSSVDGLGVANKDGASISGTFSTLSLREPGTLAHELLHLAGIDDNYHDVYSVNGKEYVLPQTDPPKSVLTAFARKHHLPPPPAGKVYSRNNKGVARCDIMGTGAELACRKLSKKDVKTLNARAGVSVVANPGDLLLNKNSSNQNYGVGFRTTVFAAPGSTTVARGVSVYCIDHSLTIPFEGGFDVRGNAAELPGYESLAKLLQLSGGMQQNLDDTPIGMLAAVWNLTDGSPLATSGTAAESRALMAQAGVAEDSVPGGLPDFANPNASSPGTAAVDADAVVPTIAARPTKVQPTATVGYAQLSPSRVRAGRRVRADLLVSVTGDADRVAMTLQRKAGRRYKRVRSLRGRKIKPGSTLVALKLGELRVGRYRMAVTVSKSGLKQATTQVKFRAAAGRR